ncbi:hypothetical protein Tco_1081679 [Tanacetum coccineum]|uniref:Uncharacterized protein n=1 Tax=Tanacetum coccineum TaxID=301880 RepID=A0ABQ5HZI3_9ASTR
MYMFKRCNSDRSLSKDLFAELALSSVVAATAEVSFFVCYGSVRAQGIVEMSVSVMVSMTSGGGVPRLKKCALFVIGNASGVYYLWCLYALEAIKKVGAFGYLKRADSSDWNDVLVFFAGKLDEDRMIVTKLNRLREEILVICKKRRNLVDELRSIKGIVVVRKAAKFLSDIVSKDNAQVEQLREIESQMECRALEKELHVQKIEHVGEWDLSKRMALYSKSVAADDFEFARRITMLYQEMEIAYGEELDLIQELEVVPGVAVAAKTVEFLNDKLWKDDKVLTKLHNIEILARDCDYQKEEFVERL